MSRMSPLRNIATLLLFFLLIPVSLFVSTRIGVQYNSEFHRYVESKILERKNSNLGSGHLEEILSEAESRFGKQNLPSYEDFISHAYSQSVIYSSVAFVTLFLFLGAGRAEAGIFLLPFVVLELTLSPDAYRFSIVVGAVLLGFLVKLIVARWREQEIRLEE